MSPGSELGVLAVWTIAFWVQGFYVGRTYELRRIRREGERAVMAMTRKQDPETGKGEA